MQSCLFKTSNLERIFKIVPMSSALIAELQFCHSKAAKLQWNPNTQWKTVFFRMINFENFYRTNECSERGLDIFFSTPFYNNRHCKHYKHRKSCHAIQFWVSTDSGKVSPSTLPNYENLEFIGIFGTTTPFDRIRVWRKKMEVEGRTNVPLYDCVCNGRKPLPSLRNMKRHAYRHHVQHYICSECGLLFNQHWR